MTISVGAKTFKTKVIENTIAPTWNAYFEVSAEHARTHTCTRTLGIFWHRCACCHMSASIAHTVVCASGIQSLFCAGCLARFVLDDTREAVKTDQDAEFDVA